MKLKSKSFQETRYYYRPPGDSPDSWKLQEHTESLDKQINDWVDRSGAILQQASAPGMTHLWLDDDKTIKCLVIAVIVFYLPGEEATERYDAVAIPLEPFGAGGPGPEDLPVDGTSGFSP